MATRVITSVANLARSAGAVMENLGTKMAVTSNPARLQPQTRILPHGPHTPQITSSFISPTSRLIGQVSINEGSSVWYGSTLRGDVNGITVGSNTHILDNCTVHVAAIAGNHSTTIGDNTVVSSGAVIHACIIGSNCLVGEGAQVLDGSELCDNSILLPGSVISPGKKMLGGRVYGGVPAVEIRLVNEGEIESLVGEKTLEISRLAGLHAYECSKTPSTLEEDANIRIDQLHRDPEYFQPVYRGAIKDEADVLGMGQAGRIFNSSLTDDIGYPTNKEK